VTASEAGGQEQFGLTVNETVAPVNVQFRTLTAASRRALREDLTMRPAGVIATWP
jgi:hypothetical protein